MPRAAYAVIGSRFSRLTVIREIPDGGLMCRCDCGVVTEAAAKDLRVGNMQSCGCLRDEKSRQRGQKRRQKLGRPVCGPDGTVYPSRNAAAKAVGGDVGNIARMARYGWGGWSEPKL
jgi:hypothetical protein